MSEDVVDDVFSDLTGYLRSAPEQPIPLWAARRVLEASSNQIADALGVTRTQVSRYWRGARKIPPHRLESLLTFLRKGIVGARLACIYGQSLAKRNTDPGYALASLPILETKLGVAEAALTASTGVAIDDDVELRQLWDREIKRLKIDEGKLGDSSLIRRLERRLRTRG